MNDKIIEKIKKNWDKEKLIKFVQYSADTAIDEDEKMFFLAVEYYILINSDKKQL